MGGSLQATMIGTWFAVRDDALHDLGMKRHSVQSN